MNIDFARQQMVEQQVRAWDVLDPDILTVLMKVPREQFVPPGFEVDEIPREGEDDPARKPAPHSLVDRFVRTAQKRLARQPRAEEQA